MTSPARCEYCDQLLAEWLKAVRSLETAVSALSGVHANNFDAMLRDSEMKRLTVEHSRLAFESHRVTHEPSPEK